MACRFTTAFGIIIDVDVPLLPLPLQNP